MQKITSLSSRLLATDTHGSVLSHHATQQSKAHSYTPFGYDPSETPESTQQRFNAQPRELTCKYILGNGYRSYNPSIMRFNSPDNLSPFNEGGLNSYTYCSNDPVNYTDPTGHKPKGQTPQIQLGKAYYLAVESILPISSIKEEISTKTAILQYHKQNELNYAFNNPGKLEEYHNLLTSKRSAGTRKELHSTPTQNSILPQPDSNFRVIAEASKAGGALKNFKNKNPGAEPIYNQRTKTLALENELAILIQELSSVQDNNQNNRSST
ncbi:RHS repeat-associated core domain-containing protein [Pseudomonas sp. CCOS 191]|uniref:RHS repeat-associated core domain-containing protein n=1 Tax=Pseudomonas sp. CCOS 191 TaxID=1649877 RepID=UPI0018E6BA1A|nr:RHS repeat-associated core domain-containing protein [Pseudomonas sp. CCOS 191]MBI6951116.1 RHS repeat-associated core domain-containing protein [Pseudomonas sp. CCOS 191]